MKYNIFYLERRENLGKGKAIIAILSGIIIVAYIISAIYLLIVHQSDTYVISQGTVAQEDETVGYIIRDEQVKKSDNNNGIYAIASEGQRVAINEPIFRYYSDTEKQINSEINDINYKIQDLLEKDKSVTSADIKAIEKQIEEKMQNINTNLLGLPTIFNMETAVKPANTKQ